MRIYNAMTLEELTDFFREIGEPTYRAKQLYQFIHKQKGDSLDSLSVFSKKLKDKLNDLGRIESLSITQVFTSQIDGTKKYLLQLIDGQIVEAVYMPYRDRTTACISTQVGCKMGCAFCASTKAAFQRNLEAWEILEELYTMERETGNTIDNIVLMGIGEPLDNYDEVIRFLRMLQGENGRNMSMRNITLSTCGIVPRIYDLAEEGLPINLAISLHSTTDAHRQTTMPIAKRYSIDEIIQACRHYFEVTGRRVSFEYVLLRGENDTKADADRLGKLVSGPAFHVNLIPLNEIDEFDHESARENEMLTFQSQLEKRHVNATIRSKKGADIDAACGQLRIAYEVQKQTDQERSNTDRKGDFHGLSFPD